MHELPKELTKSLRSWRGSVYIDEPIDLEKQEGYDDKAFDEALSSTADSLIPVCEHATCLSPSMLTIGT